MLFTIDFAWLLPDALYLVAVEYRVSRNEDHFFFKDLGDKESVKRISMMGIFDQRRKKVK